MTAEQIIEHLRRGIDHGITISPYEAGKLVKLVEEKDARIAEALRLLDTIADGQYRPVSSIKAIVTRARKALEGVRE